jgi:hypothetical protein
MNTKAAFLILVATSMAWAGDEVKQYKVRYVKGGWTSAVEETRRLARISVEPRSIWIRIPAEREGEEDAAFKILPEEVESLTDYIDDSHREMVISERGWHCDGRFVIWTPHMGIKFTVAQRRLKIIWRSERVVGVDIFDIGRDANALIGELEAVTGLVAANVPELREKIDLNRRTKAERVFVDIAEESRIGKFSVKPGRYELFLVERDREVGMLYLVETRKGDDRLVTAARVVLQPSEGDSHVPLKYASGRISEVRMGHVTMTVR